MPMGLNNPLLSGLNSLGMNGINVLNSLLMGQNAIFNYPNIFMNNQNAQNVQSNQKIYILFFYESYI